MNTVIKSLALFLSLMMVLAACTGEPEAEEGAMMEGGDKEGAAMMEKAGEGMVKADEGAMMKAGEGEGAMMKVEEGVMVKEGEGMVKKEGEGMMQQ